MTLMKAFQRLARFCAGAVGRETALVRSLRPAYERILAWISGEKGVPWEINGVEFRLDPNFRAFDQAYDPPVAEFIRSRVKPGQLCFNVGANIGIYVLQFAHWSRPDGRVVAFEPNPATFDALSRHVALNGLESRVVLERSAVSNEPGEADFFAVGADGRNRLGSPNEELAGQAVKLRVPLVTLDRYCANGPVPDWIIMDIEGFEAAALEGARGLIARGRGKLTLIVEMHPQVWPAGTTPQTMRRLLDELGLRAVPLLGQKDPVAEYGIVHLEYAR